MTAFARPSLIHDRYAEIAQTSKYTYDDDDLVNYAEFLQNHGRYMSKGGYVDSSRRIRSLYRQQEGLQLSKHDSSKGNLLLPSLGKPSSSAPPTITPSRKNRGTDGTELPSAISTSVELKKQAKEFEKQMRLIKSEMIKAKKSEREVKRLEGDIKKEQQHLRQSLRKLDMDHTMKRYQAEKHLSKNLEEKDRIEREFVKTREKQTRQRTDHNIESLQASKDKGRRNLLLCNDLARQYRNKTNELEVKHLHLDRLHTDFEQKVERKELEEARLKKELAEIALALNLEAQKAKADIRDFTSIVDRDRTHMIQYDLEQEQKLEQRLNKTQGDLKSHEFQRRRLSGDLTARRSMLDTKQREALRRIGDTRDRLETIYTKQRQLTANAARVDQDRRANHLNGRMNDADKGRTHLMNQYMRDKAEKSGRYEREGSNRTSTQYTDHETKQHEDRMRHLAKTLDKEKEIDFELRKSVKEAEFQRRKKEQEVQKLRDDLVRKKQEDAKKIREAIAQAEQQERELERHVVKENTKLNKLQTRQENRHSRLAHQQEHLRESRSLLDAHEREHKRLLRAETLSQSSQSLNDI